MTLTLNISPCPNDTFMFDALINRRIDTEGLEFEVTFADIEQLNDTVRDSSPDISKISYAILPIITDNYALLDSGSALGRANGPLLVGKGTELGSNPKVAIPGELTTANLLMNKIFPEVTDKHAMLFSKIAEAVSSGEYDAGVLIHEGRFTYQSRGLHLIADLGKRWEEVSGLPLPLGGIVVNRELPVELQRQIERLLAKSIRYAFDNPDASHNFVAEHAQEIDPEVTKAHISLFVNQYSLTLGKEGRMAVKELLNINSDKLFIR